MKKIFFLLIGTLFVRVFVAHANSPIQAQHYQKLLKEFSLKPDYKKQFEEFVKKNKSEFIRFNNENVELFYNKSFGEIFALSLSTAFDSVITLGLLALLVHVSLLKEGKKITLQDSIIVFFGGMGLLALIKRSIPFYHLYVLLKIIGDKPFAVLSKEGIKIDDNPVMKWDIIKTVEVTVTEYFKTIEKIEITDKNDNTKTCGIKNSFPLDGDEFQTLFCYYRNFYNQEFQ